MNCFYDVQYEKQKLLLSANSHHPSCRQFCVMPGGAAIAATLFLMKLRCTCFILVYSG